MGPIGRIAVVCQVLTATTVILLLTHCLQGTIQAVFDATLKVLRRGAEPTSNAARPLGSNGALPVPRTTKWRFRSDGTVDRMRRLRKSKESPHAYEILTITDVNGSQVWKGDRWHVPFGHVEFTRKTLDRVAAEKRVKPLGWELVPPSTLDFPVAVGEDGDYDVWRYNRRRRCFEGHHTRGAPIGCLGRNGFAESREQAEPFEACIGYHAFVRGGGKNGLILWMTRRGVYRIDLAQRKIRTLAGTEAGAGYVSAQLIAWDKAREPRQPWSRKQALVIELTPCTYKVVVPEPYAEHEIKLPPTQRGAPADTRFGLHRGVLYAQRHVQVDAPTPSASEAARDNPDSDEPAPWRGRHAVELYRIEDDCRPVFVNRYGWPPDPAAIARETSLRLDNAPAQGKMRNDPRVLVHESAPSTFEVFVASPDPAEYRIRIPPRKTGGTRECVTFGACHGVLYAQRRVGTDPSRDTAHVVELYSIGECSAPYLVSRKDPNERFAALARRSAVTSIHPLAYCAVVHAVRRGWTSGYARAQLDRLLLPPDERRLHRVCVSDWLHVLSTLARNSLPLWPPAVTTVILIAAALLLGRRRGLSRQAILGWCAWTLLFNVSGFLACLSLRPIRRPECPACGNPCDPCTPLCAACGKTATVVSHGAVSKGQKFRCAPTGPRHSVRSAHCEPNYKPNARAPCS